MRGLTRNWVIPTTAPVVVDAGASCVEPLVARVLAARGLADPDIAREFLEPSLNRLHDPSLIPDLDRAAERLLAAAKAGGRGGQSIVIYGDYDVDGITATAILYHTLRTIAPDARISTYVPHRVDEGYGINTDAIRKLAEKGAQVIVSVDCGITAIEPAKVARQLGVDLIITDHHNPPESIEQLPPAYAVVHPRRPGSVYPFGELCGAGVAYKLAWRLATMHCGASRVGDELRSLLIELLALAALGTIADVVPLIGENRILATFGLRRIKHSPLPGLRALIEASGLAGDNIDAERVGFSLGPRLNACGRMGHAKDAVELFTTADEQRAVEIAAGLTRLNDERRAVTGEIFSQAVEMAEAAGMIGADRRAIVLAGEEWHTGVLGIVCSRLVDRFARPVILMQRQDEICTGSGRSIDGYSLYAALEACEPLLVTFGGHDMAAGLKLRTCDLDTFTGAMIDHANARLTPNDLVRRVSIDCDATLAELNPIAVGQLERLAPFGRGNPSVHVRVRSVTVTKAEQFGARGGHLSLRVRQNTRQEMRLVAWRWGEHRASIPVGSSADIVVRPKVSTWNGRIEPELLDIRVHESV